MIFLVKAPQKKLPKTSVREGGDEGKPIVYFHPNSKSSQEYLKAAKELWDFIEEVNQKKLADNSSIQPVDNGKSACSY